VRSLDTDRHYRNVKAEKLIYGVYANIIGTGNSKRQHIHIGSHICHVQEGVMMIMSVLATVGQVNFRRSGFVLATFRCSRFLAKRPTLTH